MKTFLANKLNILLSLLLVSVVGAGGYIGFNVLRSNKVTVPDFLGKDKAEAIAWCGQLSDPEACEFVFEDTSNTEKDKIFKQSVSAGNELKGKITFNISSGIVAEVEIPQINENTVKQDIENWKNENNIQNLNYVEEYSDTVVTGNIIRIEPSENIKTDTPVTVYVSKGKKEESSSVNKIEVKAGAYLNLSVSEFEAKAKELGLVPNHRTSNDASSSSVKKGNIVWHGSGSYEKGETINYGVCTEEVKGISVKEDAYVGKTEAEFKSIAESLKLKAVHNSAWDEETTDSAKAGKVCKHGYSNNYEEGEDFRYGLYKLKSSASSEIKVSMGQYVGKSEADFKKIGEDLGLKPNHDTGRDAYSSTVAKGSVVTHGYGTYEKGETFNYGLSLGPENGSSSTSIVVSAGKYIGKSEEEFKKIATDLGLKPNHKTSLDQKSNTVAKGNIVWHGSGTYVKDEEFNYGLSLGSGDSQNIIVTMNQYVGKSEADFKKIGEDLGLKPNHDTGRDAYSSTVAKGNVVTHGYGTYEKGETFNYGLSLGPQPASEKVNVVDKSGSSEAEFRSYIESLGLKPGSRSEAYSSSIGEGLIISNDTGAYDKGSAINYKVSLGPEPEKECVLNNISDIASLILSPNDYNGAKAKMENYLNNAGFTNYTINGEKSTDDGEGVLISITVNGNSHYTRASYPASAAIVVTISTGYVQG